MSVADRIEEIELESSRKSAAENPENARLQKNKLALSHPYEKYFLNLFYDAVLGIVEENSYYDLVFLGAGAGNEAAYVRSKLPNNSKITLTDLSWDSLKHYKGCFENYNAPLPDEVLTCSFNELPFSRMGSDCCAVAFLCLHHSDSIERVICHILECFDHLILLEPMTNSVLRFLAKLGIAQRPEGVDYRPARIDLSFFESIAGHYDAEIRTYVQMPRDYLPFISHLQGVVFVEDNMRIERLWSKLLFEFQVFLNSFLSRMHFGNFALVHLSRTK